MKSSKLQIEIVSKQWLLETKGRVRWWFLAIGIEVNKIFKVGIYIRLSREDGDKLESDSISNQRDILQRYIKENGLIFVDEYKDDGISGTTFDRPDFNRMIEDIENKKINMVITKDLSRLGRDYIKTGYYIENYFPEKNVRYVSILDGIDTFIDSTNNDVTPFKAIINDMYAKDISKKIKGVLREKELRGEYLGSIAPYGYKKSKTHKNKLEIDENVSYVIEKIFELYSQGNGVQRISNILDKEGIDPPSKYLNQKHQRTTWSPKSIRAILVNEAYIGNTVQNKCVSVSYKVKKRKHKNENEYIRVENTHEAIISKELFTKVQEILKSRKSMSAPKHDELLKGLIFCHNCERQLRICYRGQKKKIGYIDCALARGKDKKCRTCNYNYRKFENIVLNQIKEICLLHYDKNALKLIYEKSKDAYNSIIKKEENILANITDKIADTSKKLDKMYFDNLNGIISNDDYFRYSRTFIEERKKLNNQKKIIEEKICIIKEKNQKNKDEENIDKIIEDFLSFEKEKLNRKILFELINKIELDEFKNIYIYFNFSELNIIKEQLNNVKFI